MGGGVTSGHLQHRGRSLSVVGHRAWDLARLARVRIEGGTEAVRALLTDPAPDDPEQPDHGPREHLGGPAGVGRMWHAIPDASNS